MHLILFAFLSSWAVTAIAAPDYTQYNPIETTTIAAASEYSLDEFDNNQSPVFHYEGITGIFGLIRVIFLIFVEQIIGPLFFFFVRQIFLPYYLIRGIIRLPITILCAIVTLPKTLVMLPITLPLFILRVLSNILAPIRRIGQFFGKVIAFIFGLQIRVFNKMYGLWGNYDTFETAMYF